MMKQYWTPLARILGLYERSGAVDATAPMPTIDEEDHRFTTHWPELFNAFRRHALDEWLPTCQRHAELNATEKLALHAMTITPCDPGIAQQLAQWKQEGSEQELIRWLVQGPWSVPEVGHSMDFSQFKALSFGDLELPVAHADGARYDWRMPAEKSLPGQVLWRITDQTSWLVPVEKPQTAPLATDSPVSWQALLTDAASVRRLPPFAGLVILGQEKTVRMPDGQHQVLKDKLTLRWEQKNAVYMAVQGAFVSGLHLAIRAGPDGIECQDMGSTNGSFIGDQRLIPGQWTELPVKTRIFLGGTASDLRAQAPSLEITGQTGDHPVSLDVTPLRLRTEPNLLMIYPAKASEPIGVKLLPFLIGRDSQCDWVVGAQDLMVSRMHLRIEQIDVDKGRILVRDLSRQGLTHCDGRILDAMLEGAWVSEDCELVLGKSSDHEGLAFRFRWPDPQP